MNVPDAPYVLELPNVLHLASDVTAVVHPGVTALRLAGELHPSAAVCGTPTPAARAAIAELEHLDRGRYSGPVGWLDSGGDGEFAIALRCGLVSADDPTPDHALRRVRDRRRIRPGRGVRRDRGQAAADARGARGAHPAH